MQTNRDRRALLVIPSSQMHKIVRGIALPDGIEMAGDGAPQWNPQRRAWMFQVEGPSLTWVDEGGELPMLEIDWSYNCIVVVRPT